MSVNVFDTIKIKNIVTDNLTVNVLNTAVTTLNIGGKASINMGDNTYTNGSSTTSNPSGNKVQLNCPLKLPQLSTSSFWSDNGSSSLSGFGVSQLISLTTSGASSSTLTFYAVKLGGIIYLYSPGASITTTSTGVINVTIPDALKSKYGFAFTFVHTASSNTTGSIARFTTATNLRFFGNMTAGNFASSITFTFQPFCFVYATADDNWGT